MVISSGQNPKIKRIASLKEKKYRAEYGEYLIEGVKMVKEAILSGQDIVSVIGVAPALTELPPCRAEVIETDSHVFSKLSETKTPQGVMAVLKIPVNERVAPTGNCVVLDGVSDPGNLGTIIRTSAALGIKDLYLCGCTDAYSPKCVRSSMSGIFFTNIHELDRETVGELLKDHTVIVADMHGEDLFDCSVKGDHAVVIGNEANGVSEYFKDIADKTVAIPMRENIESLNAAVSFAVIAYTLANKR